MRKVKLNQAVEATQSEILKPHAVPARPTAGDDAAEWIRLDNEIKALEKQKEALGVTLGPVVRQLGQPIPVGPVELRWIDTLSEKYDLKMARESLAKPKHALLLPYTKTVESFMLEAAREKLPAELVEPFVTKKTGGYLRPFPIKKP